MLENIITSLNQTPKKRDLKKMATPGSSQPDIVINNSDTEEAKIEPRSLATMSDKKK